MASSPGTRPRETTGWSSRTRTPSTARPPRCDEGEGCKSLAIESPIPSESPPSKELTHDPLKVECAPLMRGADALGLEQAGQAQIVIDMVETCRDGGPVGAPPAPGSRPVTSPRCSREFEAASGESRPDAGTRGRPLRRVSPCPDRRRNRDVTRVPCRSPRYPAGGSRSLQWSVIDGTPATDDLRSRHTRVGSPRVARSLLLT